MSTHKHPLTPKEIQLAFASTDSDPGDANSRVILSPTSLAQILGLSPKTIYEWIAKGRLDGSFRKRGKHLLIWRDRAIAILMNGREWKDD